MRAAIYSILQANTGAGHVLGESYDVPNDPQKTDFGAYPVAEIHYDEKTVIANGGDNRDWEIDMRFLVVVYVPMDPDVIGTAEKTMDTVMDTLDNAIAQNLTLGGAVIVVEPAQTKPEIIVAKSKLLYATALIVSGRFLQPTNALS